MVKEELDRLGLKPASIELGVVELSEDIEDELRVELKERLLRAGLELLDDHRSILIERVKNVITELIHHTDELPTNNYSDYISAKLGYDYTYLSKYLFGGERNYDSTVYHFK